MVRKKAQSKVHRLAGLQQQIRDPKKSMILLFVALFAVFGLIFIVATRAAGPSPALEPEQGAKSANITTLTDAAASNSQAVQFKTAAVTCTGVAMTNGQTDINNNAAGTTFCISGVHNNWSLTPKSGNTFIGDGTAVLDGTNTTQYAIKGNAGITNVTVRNLEIRNYTTANQHGAVETWQASTGWVLDKLQVHDNGFYGANIAVGTMVMGGRYYNNHQGGISGGNQANWTVDGVEIDHNNFTDNTYTTRSVDCGFEAGGMKWVGNNVTIKNSKVHDNACKGLWADIGAVNTVITNNEVYDNWDEGIFFEISTSATITGNNSHGNGWHDISGCGWGWGGGITTSTSGLTQNGSGIITITGNILTDNCNGITLIDQGRTDSGCTTTSAGRCVLQNVTVSGNTITGSTRSGAKNVTGAYTDVAGNNLTTHNITFGTNTINANMSYCKFACP